MAAMMLVLKILIMAFTLLIYFPPGLFKAAPFFTAWLFLCGFHFFLYFIRPQNQLNYG